MSSSPSVWVRAAGLVVALTALAPLASSTVERLPDGFTDSAHFVTRGASYLEAQVPSLDQVDSLTARGEVVAARSALTSWWEARFEEAGPVERQTGLWLRGKLTVDPGMARRDYLRLVLEYPGGPHSADALLRLAHMEHAAGRMLDAAGHFEQLLRDYPESPHRLEARRWMEANREAVSRARAASRSADAGGDPVEIRPPTVDDDVGDRSGSASSAPGAGPVSVQLGAFSSEARARDLVERAEAQGIDGLRLVRVEGSRLFRVRTGRFPDRSAATSLRSRIEGLGFDARIVTDGEEESMVP